MVRTSIPGWSAANAYKALPRISEKERESNHRGGITSVYKCEPVAAADRDDALQRFGYVKVEATSFTVSEPAAILLKSRLLILHCFRLPEIMRQHMVDLAENLHSLNEGLEHTELSIQQPD